MEEGDWRLRLTRGDIIAWAILPVPRKEILEKMSELDGVVEKACVDVAMDKLDGLDSCRAIRRVESENSLVDSMVDSMISWKRKWS